MDYDELDQEVLSVAREVDKLNKQGGAMLRQATLTATAKMAKMAGKLDTKEAKIEALKHHALYMGVGTGFMDLVVPKAREMPDELKEAGASEGEYQILTALWLAKVFIEIEKALRAEGEQ